MFPDVVSMNDDESSLLFIIDPAPNRFNLFVQDLFSFSVTHAIFEFTDVDYCFLE
jgi:hypothetical protein